MDDPMKNPRFWRDRAEETRSKAESYRIAERERKRLLRIAVEYEQLADRAEQWQTASQVEQQRMTSPAERS